MRNVAITATLAAALCWAVSAHAAPVSPETPANVTADQVKAALAGAKEGKGADLAGKSLRNLDLSDMDSLVAPVVAQGLTADKGEIPIFKDANFTGARVQARFTGGELQGAKFTGGDVSAHLNNQSMGLMHTEWAAPS